MRVERSGFLALVAAIAGAACGGGSPERDGSGDAGRAPGESDAAAPDGGVTSEGDANGGAEDGTTIAADGQSTDAAISTSDGSVVQDAAADTAACQNPCGGTCCAEGTVCVDDGRGNKQCAQACTDSVQCPSSAPCCGPAQEGLCGKVGTTWACLPATLCAGEYCRCATNSVCGPTQEGLPGVCGPLIQLGTVSPPVCNAPAAKTTLYIHGRDKSGLPAGCRTGLGRAPGSMRRP